jgi:hypothetical protein
LRLVEFPQRLAVELRWSWRCRKWSGSGKTLEEYISAATKIIIAPLPLGLERWTNVPWHKHKSTQEQGRVQSIYIYMVVIVITN